MVFGGFCGGGWIRVSRVVVVCPEGFWGRKSAHISTYKFQFWQNLSSKSVGFRWTKGFATMMSNIPVIFTAWFEKNEHLPGCVFFFKSDSANRPKQNHPNDSQPLNQNEAQQKIRPVGSSIRVCWGSPSLKPCESWSSATPSTNLWKVGTRWKTGSKGYWLP